MRQYQQRVSGLLLDRINIHIEVPRVDYEKLHGTRVGSRAHPFVGVLKPQEMFSKLDSRIPTIEFLTTALALIVCNADMCLGKYGSSAPFLRNLNASCAQQ